MKALSRLSVCVQGGIRRDKFMGKEYLIAPVIAMTEGVRSGSMGPVLYLEEEYGKFPESWNGVPLPVFHPEDGNGNYVSCNTPEIIEGQSVGQLFNVVLEDSKLKGELWIDVERAKIVDPEVLAILESGRMLEISTSHWSDDEDKSGDFKGEHYDAIARNVRPDHLALLPGGKGACSVKDGCGAPRTNTSREGGEKMPPGKEKSFVDKIKDPFMLLAEGLGLKVQESSHEQTKGNLQMFVDALDTTEKVDSSVTHYVQEVFDNYFVYEQMSRDGTKLFKQNYKKQKNDNIKLEGKPQEVKMDTSYKAVKSNKRGGEKTMDKVKELVSALIANASTKYTEADREDLQGLTECQLSKMVPVVNEVKKPSEDAVKTLIANEGSPFAEKDKALLSNMSVEQFTAISGMYPEQKKEDVKANAKPQTEEEFIKTAPAGIQEVLTSALSMQQQQKASLVAGLVANKECKFTEEELKVKGVDELTKLADLAHVETDYSGNGGELNTNVDDEKDNLQLPKMDFKA